METSANGSCRRRSCDHPEEEEQEEVGGGDEPRRSILGVQSHYLRCPSPSWSMTSGSRFSEVSHSVLMEPIHLSSAVAAKKIISEELPRRGSRTESVPESMLEPAEQLMVEDLYNRVRDLMDDRSPYNTPCVLDLQRAMVQDRLEAPSNAVDEVWPNIFIAEKSVAVNKARLKRMGITHILNAAHGTGVYTNQSFYADMNIQYSGIELDDFADADIAAHFRPSAEFLDEALLTHKGKVLVVSMMGASRSAVLVASYLMIFQHLSIMEALTSIRKKRAINPNEGFLKQLRELNETLMEERDDDDETLSQCSVIDAHTRNRIFGGEGGVVDTDGEDGQSLVEAEARSILMAEEGDEESVLSSVASSATADVFRAGLTAAHSGMPHQQQFVLQDEGRVPELDDGDDDGGGDDLESMIRDWQRRNEKYQDDDWWEAQLNSDEEDDDSSSSRPETKMSKDQDTDSVTSEDIRAIKERMKHRVRRPSSDAASTTSQCSYADLWKHRLREIEEQAAARYRHKDKDGPEIGHTVGNNLDSEVASILSDTSTMYNFCQKNKEKMSPLERWRVKRIQFGWNKKDRDDGDKSSVADGDKGHGEGSVQTPSLQDVNLTAYQSWKLRQQRRFGEENTDEILELSRAEDSATIKKRQRREEILERSKKTLEESQSMCGWDGESCVSGATIPLSAFWAGAGVCGPPSVANDDNVSMHSGRSSVVSSVSRPRSVGSSQSILSLNLVPPAPPIVPVPTVQGPGGEPMVNLASIQNWIANVVSETIKQKQSEMSLPPPSRAASELSFTGAASAVCGRSAEDDRVSQISSASYSTQGRTPSLLSAASSSLSGTRGGPSRRSKITTTSVPLFSLFQDQVDLDKLDALDREIKSDMRDKMNSYEKKKILEDNKRSTLYKKKKPRGEEEEEQEEEQKKREEEFLQEAKMKEKQKRTYGLSGRLNLKPSLEKDQNTSVEDWLKSVRPPQKKSPPLGEDGPSEDPYDDLDASASQFDFSSRRASFSDQEQEELPYGLSPAGGSRLHPVKRREFFSSNFPQSESQGRGQRSWGEVEQLPVGHRGDEEEDDVAAFIAQTRQRVRARAAAEAQDEEVLAAWRAQQDAKAQAPRHS